MKILYLTARQPYPFIKGDQALAYHQIKELSKNHEIILVSFCKSEGEVCKLEMSKYCKEMYLFDDIPVMKLYSMIRFCLNLKPLQVNMFNRKSVALIINNLQHDFNPDVIHVQTIRMAHYCDNFVKNKSIDLIDALSLNMYKRMSFTQNPLKLVWFLEYLLLKKYEKEVLKNFRKKFLVAKRDWDYLGDEEIIVNPLGVELEPCDRSRRHLGNPVHILFHGNLSYYPNVEGALFLIKKVYPRLKEVHKEIRIILMGANPDKRLLKEVSEDIQVTGFVKRREDYFKLTDIAIYPIFNATGLQSKVLEAMAAGIPSIISPECKNGIENLVDFEHVLVAESLEDYVTCFHKLIEDDNFRQSISEKSIEFVEKNHSWSKHVDILESTWKAE